MWCFCRCGCSGISVSRPLLASPHGSVGLDSLNVVSSWFNEAELSQDETHQYSESTRLWRTTDWRFRTERVFNVWTVQYALLWSLTERWLVQTERKQEVLQWDFLCVLVTDQRLTFVFMSSVAFSYFCGRIQSKQTNNSHSTPFSIHSLLEDYYICNNVEDIRLFNIVSVFYISISATDCCFLN